MTKILIVKTSSMGDIIHTLPALTEAGQKIPQVSFDWIVEEAFAEIPTWHPLVNKVIPIAWRRFRKEPLKSLRRGEWLKFLKSLREVKYDYIIDAQGLLKSAAISLLARGKRCGLDKDSAWEKLASLAYQCKVNVSPAQHAILRMRQIFSRVLNYPLEDGFPDYNVNLQSPPSPWSKPYLVFIHGTSWKTKEWPEEYWKQLTDRAKEQFSILLPWGTPSEFERGTRIVAGIQNAQVLPRTSLTQMANLLWHASGVVSVDTGLSHLAAALKVPTLTLYGPTDPNEVGTMGLNQKHLVASFSCSPCLRRECGYKIDSSVKPACFTTLSPEFVWGELTKVMCLG